MHILIVTAHPNPDGFAHHIADTYKQTAEKYHDVKTIDLYQTEHKQDFLLLDDKNKPLPDPYREQIQSLITRADEIVLTFPMRWFDCPAIVKNWFDTNFTAGFAYKYVKGKVLPRRLLKGKKAKIFITANAPRRVYRLPIGRGAYMNRYRGRMWYTGINLQRFVIFGNMGKYRYKHHRDAMLQRVKKIAI